MLKGSVMQLICPECDAKYYLFGDFIESEGQIVRAATNHWSTCSKCTIMEFEVMSQGVEEE